MSNLILAGASALGGTLLRTAGNVALGLANQAITRAFDNRVIEGPRLETLHIQSSRDGAPMARIYGKVRVAGQVIWAARVREIVTEERQGGKGGGPTTRNYRYTISFAVGLCEGEILSVEQIWANGQALQISGLNMRLYHGSDVQAPDPLIAEIEAGDVPAFRGTAYMVFEDMPLDDFGARLPQLNFEIIRVPERATEQPRMEELITGINLIPGSGEFSYGSTIIEQRTGPGSSRAINMNNVSGRSDFDAAVDQMEAQLPECKSVAIQVSWFGNDLRAGEFLLRPGVESAERFTQPDSWQVSGEDRAAAYVVSTLEGRPVYGGTPSDKTIIEAIQNLKARGFHVSIYPFILMDVVPDNELPNPYGGIGQPVFPWRGRITCDPAPGTDDSVDRTAEAAMQIGQLFGECSPDDFTIEDGNVGYQGPDEYSIRRMVLHYAHLATLAGGVENFIISSEMRGVTTVRDGADNYPAVQALIGLTADVRSIMGGDTKLTYAADWSEYFGHHPNDGSGDVRYHLDPLWADDNIDGVGIDAYFPLTDWRDDPDHLDRQLYSNIYESDYLYANMEGGEGYDWFYASSEDRQTQMRTPITDGLAGKPWVFRYKDVKSWWANPHYERIDGQEMSEPTDWLPQSKPILFTEIGCPAIDKGANQPNVFWDPKSSESFAPYFSNTQRDDLIQRQYIETFLSYWQTSANNPISSVYGGPMADMDNAHIWCWDARPYPDFPARLEIWSDGGNWRRGHWLNGRTGLVHLADVVNDIARQASDEPVDVSRLFGIVSGYILDRPMSARGAIFPLSQIYGFDLIERVEHLAFVTKGGSFVSVLDLASLVHENGAVMFGFKRDDAHSRLKDVRMNFIDQEHDYQGASVYARDLMAETVHILDLQAPLVLDSAQARFMSNLILNRELIEREQAEFTVSSTHLNMEVGDVVQFNDGEELWQITDMDGLGKRSARARRVGSDIEFIPSGGEAGTDSQPVWVSAPDGFALDIADFGGQGARNGPLVGALLDPWVSSTVLIPNGAQALLTQPVAMGALLQDLPSGPVGRFDKAAVVEIFLPGVTLSALSELDVLAGGNLLAVETVQGWEILQCQEAELVAPHVYKISRLLRGLYGTDRVLAETVPSGARTLYLGAGWQNLPVDPALRGSELTLHVETNGRAESTVFQLGYEANHLRPLSPVHIKTVLVEDVLHINWVRRTRIGGDDWASLDVPLGEEFERYALDFIGPAGVFLTKETSQPNLQISLSELEAEAGETLANLTVSIFQISQSVGRGARRQVSIAL